MLAHLLLTLAWFGAPEPVATPDPPAPRVGWFIGHSVRVLGNFGVASPALGTEFGLRWRNLSLGIAALYKPANWGPARFEHPVPDGVDFKGKRTVSFGAQYATLGLFIAPAVPLAGADRLALEFPLVVGVGFLGTPLLGDDRKTPDGRRVSAWENELTGGDDLNLGFAGELGARLRVRPAPVAWFHVVAGIHYTFFAGYDSSVVKDPNVVDGVSGSIGFVFGAMPRGAAR